MRFYIIGNGFDLHHGLHTKYTDFRDYLRCHFPDDLDAFIDNILVEKIDGSDWRNLEGWMQRSAPYRNPRYHYDDVISRNGNLVDHHDVSARVEAICVAYERLMDLMWAWIQSDSIGAPDGKPLRLDPRDCYLTFNYTRILENHYGIPPEQIFHIHGDSRESLVLGHNKRVDDGFELNNAIHIECRDGDIFIEKRYDDGLDPILENLKYDLVGAVDILYKNSREIIDQNYRFIRPMSESDEIVILGWSMGEVDSIYLEEFLGIIPEYIPLVCVVYEGSSFEEYRLKLSKHSRTVVMGWKDYERLSRRKGSVFKHCLHSY